MGRKYTLPIVRFINKIEVVESGCWNWLGYIDNRGYGNFSVWDQAEKKRYVYRAHRWLYEFVYGEQTLDLDHLCRNRKCVNPVHLEPVTCKENLLRSPLTKASVNTKKTHCKLGHELTGVLKRGPLKGKRYCRVCCTNRTRRWRALKKETA